MGIRLFATERVQVTLRLDTRFSAGCGHDEWANPALYVATPVFDLTVFYPRHIDRDGWVRCGSASHDGRVFGDYVDNAGRVVTVEETRDEYRLACEVEENGRSIVVSDAWMSERDPEY